MLLLFCAGKAVPGTVEREPRDFATKIKRFTQGEDCSDGETVPSTETAGACLRLFYKFKVSDALKKQQCIIQAGKVQKNHTMFIFSSYFILLIEDFPNLYANCLFQLLRSRESALWELEERHIQEKQQLAKRQLKDIFFLQRHQVSIYFAFHTYL